MLNIFGKFMSKREPCPPVTPKETQKTEEERIECIFNSILKDAETPEDWSYEYTRGATTLTHKVKRYQIYFANYNYADLFGHSIFNPNQHKILWKAFVGVLKFLRDEKKSEKTQKSLKELSKIFPDCG